MIALTLAQLVTATGGTLVGPRESGLVVIDGPVVTDSRAAGPGGLYVARMGEHADGHDYVAAAAQAGAVAALTSRPVPEVPSMPCIVVDDVQTAFGVIARAALKQAGADGFGPVVVGVTGSSGKTSTKDLLAQVLGCAGETVAPVNSLNGEIGVPLTVCRITPATRFLVVEMGARGVGHIRYLTTIAPPRIGVVLNVGTAHVGEFGGRDAIATAKGELVEALPAGGLAVLNADDPAVVGMAARTQARVVRVGEGPEAEIRATRIRLDHQGRAAFILTTPEGTADVRLALHGRHHVGNALAVVAVALGCGMPLAAVVDALESSSPVSRWRMEVTERPDGVTVVNDAYNANPDSMTAALAALAAMTRPEGHAHRRSVAVLGEMLELGPDARSAHEAVGAEVTAQRLDVLVTVGRGAEAIADGAVGAVGAEARHPETHRVSDADAAYTLLREKLRPGDVVLFKSSNAAGLRWLGERVAAMEVTR